ncbi:DUF429 domain-containing protein [Aureliella helgolandensis]|uniref:DUF429 domain-containing protein n=1 Tax=Aureliella helgolandensis TaxID=2527968 RepID=A0A518G9R5_9BACT|nr:DUF429 domain-containing protein [Aureliella helgolandensis]QDV25310.1 hypothetical protein Q31a_36340 [Aureliella helgolandensis]
MNKAYGGVDIGKHASFACRIDLEHLTISYPERSLGVNQILDWFTSNPVTGICIDGPPQPNQGRLAERLPQDTRYNTQRRVAEFALRIYGCYGTPDEVPDFDSNQGWMASSMHLFNSLKDHFDWNIDLGDGRGELSETHPTYAFKALLGCDEGNTHGDVTQWIVDPNNQLAPKRPRNAGGHAQRIELLNQSFDQLSFPLNETIQAWLEASIDHVDASLCALMALWKGEAMNGLMPVGDSAEGAIYIPTGIDIFNVTQPPDRGEGLPPVGRPPCQRAEGDELLPPNAIILRLGNNGPGGLTQEETIALTQEAVAEGDNWLPVGTGHSFNLCQNLQQIGHILYLAFGDTLRLRAVTSGCHRQAEPTLAYPGEFNPWPVNETYGWVEITEVTEVEVNHFQTRQSGNWKQGFSQRGGNLLFARVPQHGEEQR